MRFCLVAGICLLITAGCAGRVSAQFDVHIRPHAEKISLCYIGALRKDPAAAGEIELSVTVDGSGAVIAADLVKNTFPTDEVGHCVAAVIRAIVFPASSQNKTVTFSYPIVFTQEAPFQKRE